MTGPVAFLGTGLMGGPMCRNLARAGANVRAWNRSADKARALGEGIAVAATPAAAAQGAAACVVMLADGPACRQVIFDEGVAGALAPGALLIVMSSIGHDEALELAGMARDGGLRWIDAPVSGGVPGAEAGTLSIMAGGEAADIAAAQPILSAMGRVVHIGPAGTGSLTKLINQITVAATIATVAEAMLLAEAGGADPLKVREALLGGFAASRILELHGKRMIDGDFDPGRTGPLSAEGHRRRQARRRKPSAVAAGPRPRRPALRRSRRTWRRRPRPFRAACRTAAPKPAPAIGRAPMTVKSKEENMKMSITRRGIVRSLAMLALASTALTGLTGKATAETSLRMAVPDPIGSSVGRAATRFAELVAEKTGGEVVVEVFPDGVLFGGDQNAAINQLGAGALDGLILASSVYASFEPKMNAISLPYLFSDYDQFQSYLAGEPGDELLASLDRLGIHGLGFFLRTFRDVTTRDTPITTAEDFSGLTLRTPNNPLFVALFETLGANPTPMAFSEVYSALQLGAIDGQENPVEVPFNNKFSEVQGQLNLTQHIADSFIVALSQSAWDSIPEEQRAAVQEAADEMIAEHDAEEIAAEQGIIAELQEQGMQVNKFADGELARVQEMARSIYPQFEEQIGADFMQKSLDFVQP